MLRKRTMFWKLILSVTVIFIGFLWIGQAKVMGADCNHEVYCEDMTTCIICGKENLDETEISKVVHPFAYCYDLSTCGACEESIVEGSAEEVRHDLEKQAQFIPDGDFHTAKCFCKEESETQMHIVKCTQENECLLCQGAATSPQKIVKHEDEHLKHDADYHWKECNACDKLSMPKLEHYTDCTDKEGPCGFCGLSHEECKFVEGKIGVHKLIHDLVGEGEERHHMTSCLVCEYEIEHRAEINYNDFGSDDLHAVICVECGYHFDDEPHTYENGTCTLCGHKQQSAPVPLTGDENNIISLVLILAGALTCVLFCVTVSRKKEK